MERGRNKRSGGVCLEGFWKSGKGEVEGIVESARKSVDRGILRKQRGEGTREAGECG